MSPHILHQNPEVPMHFGTQIHFCYLHQKTIHFELDRMFGTEQQTVIKHIQSLFDSTKEKKTSVH